MSTSTRSTVNKTKTATKPAAKISTTTKSLSVKATETKAPISKPKKAPMVTGSQIQNSVNSTQILPQKRLTAQKFDQHKQAEILTQKAKYKTQVSK
jgi:hypothetical protein